MPNALIAGINLGSFAFWHEKSKLWLFIVKAVIMLSDLGRYGYNEYAVELQQLNGSASF